MKVFYLEDELFLAQVVRESLEKRGFEVMHCVSGEGAIEQCQLFSPDICLLDVMVPKVDGYEVGSAIRRWNSRLPIIFLTAKTQTKDVIAGFESGGTDYLKKPFSIEELIVRMNNQFAMLQSVSTDNKTLRLGRFTFHAQKQELTLNDQSWRLSFRESQLLKFLIDRKAGIAKRKEILLEIWGDDSFFNSRNLDVYVRKLRHRLQPDPDVKILTLKGVGYRVVEDD